MKNVERMALDYALANKDNSDPFEAFVAGFRAARSEALYKIWESPEHTYCDFYHDGASQLDRIGEEEA